MDDTIVAISTAAGSAGRAIVRLSGPEAIRLAEDVFLPRAGRLTDLGGFRACDGRVRLGSEGSGEPAELPARAYVFRLPRSYTRQDVVEFHVPGPAAAASAVLDVLVGAGARPAQPGEFTARAFFSGRIDLAAAEAVADVIDASDDAQLRSALTVLGGRVDRLCRQAAGDLTDVLAAVEAAIDLAGEDIRPDEPGELSARLRALAERLEGLATEAFSLPEGSECPRAVIAGRPNVGKSSLLNALCGTQRAITSALAGTTRDVLSAPLTLEGLGTVVLQDAAGLVRTDDSLAAAADGAARSAVSRADALLFVVDLTTEDFREDLSLLREAAPADRSRLLLVANKADLTGGQRDRAALLELESAAGVSCVATSAVMGQGLDEVRRALAGMLNFSVARSGDALGLHARQRRGLQSAAAACVAAANLLAPAGEVADVAELAAVEIRSALERLGQVCPDRAAILPEEVLAKIFARFCVGK